jgi:phosphatidate cytidylyltransferase
MFFSRLASSIALWAVLLFLIFSGWKEGFMTLLALFGLLAQWEFYRAQEEKGLRMFKKLGLFFGVLLFVSMWVLLLVKPDWSGHYVAVEECLFVLFIIAALVRLVLIEEPTQTPILTVALTLMGFFYVPYLFSFLPRLAFWPGVDYNSSFIMLYLIAVTKCTDAGAYAVGRVWGRHKMIPRISPGKTWEGFAGGVAGALFISILLPILMPEGLKGFTLVHSIIVGVLLSLVSVVGDLAESVVKRDAQVKDSGQMIPGIGGALDLIDSLLFTAPVFYFYVQFFILK